MDRDLNLAKKILSLLKQKADLFCVVNLNVESYDPKVVKAHVTLLADAKFVLLGEPVDDFEHHPELYPLKVRITWDGYNWLDANP